MQEFVYMFALLLVGAGIFSAMGILETLKKGTITISKGQETTRKKNPATFFFYIGSQIILSAFMIILGAVILYSATQK
ncbi:MAG: hypothetical protein JNL76_05525 [Alphaproteobacteria bacterium]|nr:hypothetical protein [Alphaproteobacteria bacterium]